MNNKIKLGITLLSVAFLGTVIYIKTAPNNLFSKSSDVMLGEYKNLETGLKVQEVTDEAINEVIDELVTNMGGCYKEADKKIEEGDKVDISYTQKDNPDTAQYELSVIIGDDNYPEAIFSALIGKTKDSTVEATLPEDYGGGTYSMTINKVYEKSELTDEFVKNMNLDDIATVQDLRENVTGYLGSQYNDIYNEAQKDAVLKTVLENSSVKNIPDELISEYITMITDKVNATVEATKNNSENSEEITQLTVLEDEMKENQFSGSAEDYIRWYAEKDAKEYLIFSKIAKRENIKVEDKELYSALATDWIAQTDKYPTLLDYADNCPLDQYKRAILCDKVLSFIAENSKEGLCSAGTKTKLK